MSLWNAIQRLHPTVFFELTQDGSNENRPYISRWDSDLPQPTPAEIQASLVAWQAEQTTKDQEAQALRQQILTTAQSAVGVGVDALTAGQLRALVAILLHKEGALTPDATIRPLSAWVRS